MAYTLHYSTNYQLLSKSNQNTYQSYHFQAHYFASNSALENIDQIIQHFYQALSYLLCLKHQETNMIQPIHIFKPRYIVLFLNMNEKPYCRFYGNIKTSVWIARTRFGLCSDSFWQPIIIRKVPMTCVQDGCSSNDSSCSKGTSFCSYYVLCSFLLTILIVML
jgi:hypothetical protein